MKNPLSLLQISQPLRWVIQRFSKLHILRDWYDEWLAQHAGKGHNEFLTYTLEKTGACWSVDNEAVLQTTQEGEPLILVANHPLGGLEGMLLSQLLLKYRSDVKVLTNHMLLAFKEFDDLFIGVDVLNPNKKSENARGVRAVSRHLSRGGALLVFPSGTVSHNINGQLVDPEWNIMVGHLALKYKAKCLAAHVGGRNHWSFYQSAKIHPLLRTSLLPRAMLSKKGETIPVVLGDMIEFDKASHSAQSVTEYLRIASELLNPHADSHTKDAPVEQVGLKENKGSNPLKPESLADIAPFLVREQKGFQVYCLPYEKLGVLAKPLAQVRAKTFESVGEGTGLAEDSDHFDHDYWHIVVWDNSAQCVVGGYRAANASALVAKRGLQALYSYSLFNYDQRFLASLGGSIEVGRSFVAEAYQSNPFALDLLWHGLGHFMKMHQDCHTFFGCVSISKRYAPVARALFVDALLGEHGATDEQKDLVKPISPFKYQHRFWSADLLAGLASMSAINKLLGKANYQYRVPALIRHYVSLNGKFIDFSINHGFNASLDGLIYVDLREAPLRYVKRYLGAKGGEEFCAKWGVVNAKSGSSQNAA